MNFAAFERAQVAAFAYEQARHTGSIDCMRAMCFLLRNRVKSGWGDGTWLSVIKSSPAVAAHEGFELETATMDDGARKTASDRLLQIIVRDVDDIYLAQDNFDDRVRQVVCGDDPMVKPGNKAWKPALYYAFIDRPMRPWFKENIVQRPAEHPLITNMGLMALYR